MRWRHLIGLSMPRVRELPADLIKEWAAKHAAANAKLEGRQLPDGFIRSVQAQQSLNMRKPGGPTRVTKPLEIKMENLWG